MLRQKLPQIDSTAPHLRPKAKRDHVSAWLYRTSFKTVKCLSWTQNEQKENSLLSWTGLAIECARFASSRGLGTQLAIHMDCFSQSSWLSIHAQSWEWEECVNLFFLGRQGERRNERTLDSLQTHAKHWG